MTGQTAHLGYHVLMDYSNYFPPMSDDGPWMLETLRSCVRLAGVREVHSHVEAFDGIVSPTGFAAVVLIDESHVSAHCYSDRGLLAVDVFTCGENDPDIIADSLNSLLLEAIPGINLVRRDRIARFKGD
ncbi:MAG TPA: S-adenosylmethionine decarboxylase [Candidatus Thalassarchaeaceae archaeon]|nr:S-adenosylmethionine decarboxylase [Candidatus Thalassarchaeaceae archaeon]